MTLDAIQSAILANMTATYSSPAVVTITDKVVKVKVASKPRAKKSNDGSQAAPTHQGNGDNAKVVTLSIELPAVGTYDAPSFIVAMRKAKDRNEMIQAIAGFVGYDLSANFGSQELSAKMAAQRAMVPVVAGKDRTIRSSVAGYIAGLPDHNRKLIADLEGRERLTVEALSDHVRRSLSSEAEGNVEQAHFHETMAQVERERLASIRKDLSRLV